MLARRPASARAGAVRAAYGDAARDLTALVGGGLAGGGDDSGLLEVMELTELFEEKSAAKRRTAGGSTAIARAKPMRASPRASRFPIVP